jgi:hypothetical protein
MADAVASQTIFDGERVAIMKFTNTSDGTGETKVQLAALWRERGYCRMGCRLSWSRSVFNGGL